MKKPTVLLLVFLVGVFLADFQSPALAGNIEERCLDNKDKILVANSDKTNAFASGQKTVGVMIFEFSLEYFACEKNSPKIVEVKELILAISMAKQLKVEDFSRVFVKGEDGKIYAAKVEEIPNSYDWRVVIVLNTKLENEKTRKFNVIADLPNMKPGANFQVTFQTGKMGHFITADDKTILASDFTGTAVQHFNGNRPPKLSWVTSYSYRGVKSALSPLSGLSGQLFEFRIKYWDEDNEPPKVAQVWVDLNGDGKYQKNEKFNMALTDPKRIYFVQGGVEYFRELKIIVEKPRAIKFRFYFTDGKAQAEDSPDITYMGETSESSQKPTEEHRFFVGTPVVFGPPKLSSSNFVRGETLKITLPVFHVFKNVKVDWASIAENRFGQLKFLYWQLGRRGMTSPEYKMPGDDFDFQELIIFLNTDQIKAKEASIPTLKISYRLEGDPKEFKAVSESHKIPRSDLRIESGVSQQLVRIGDQFQYRVKVVRTGDARLIDFKPKEISFEPFETLDFEQRSQNFSNYFVDEYRWTLASYYIFEKPIVLPSLEIVWRASLTKRGVIEKTDEMAIAVTPVLGKIDNPLSLWDAGHLPWLGYKTYWQIILPITLGGLVLVSISGYLAVRRLLVLIEAIQADPRWLFKKSKRRAKKILRSNAALKSLSIDAAVELLNGIKILLGLNLGLDKNAALALSANELKSLLEDQKRLDLLGFLKLNAESESTALSELESIIFRNDPVFSGLTLLKQIQILLKSVNFSPRA